jgi:hypothetical protein
MKTNIPADFSFSQSNLHTFLRCRYKFYLRYIQALVWPAQLTSDSLVFEEDRNAGIRFHQLVHQYFIGFDQDLLHQMSQNDPDPRVLEWFSSFLLSPFAELDGELHPEKTLNANIDGKLFMVKMDLLQFVEGHYHIYDWKTSRKIPNRKTLLQSVQTKLYPLVLSEALSSNFPIHFHIIELNQIDSPITFTFSALEVAKNRDYFMLLTDEILALEEHEFFRTDKLQICKTCEYRSHCNRGIKAPEISDLDFIDMEDYFETGNLNTDLV